MADVTVFVGSLDAYSPAWKPFCHGMHRYWPDRPWPLAFATNHLVAPCGSTIKVGKERDWTDRIGRALRKVKTPLILWIISDNWLSAPVDTAALIDFAAHVKRGRAEYVGVFPGWEMGERKAPFEHDPRLFVFERKNPYRASLKPAFWRVRTFLELLKEGESPWDFERWGSRRSRRYKDRFVTVMKWGYFPFVTTADPTYSWAASPVKRGRWTIAAQQYAERENLKIDFSRHPVPKDPFGGNPPDCVLP